MAKQVRYGGSFAPPLDDEKLSRYEELAANCEDEKICECMETLCKMMRKFRETGNSKKSGKPHPSGRGMIIRLEPEEVTRIWSYVPWPDELDMYSKRFNTIDPVAQTELRNAAFHLLWFGRELAQDREPITTDKL